MKIRIVSVLVIMLAMFGCASTENINTQQSKKVPCYSNTIDLVSMDGRELNFTFHSIDSNTFVVFKPRDEHKIDFSKIVIVLDNDQKIPLDVNYMISGDFVLGPLSAGNASQLSNSVLSKIKSSNTINFYVNNPGNKNTTQNENLALFFKSCFKKA